MNKILMYHSIGSRNNGEVGNELYSVPEDTFREHMRYVAGDQRQKTEDHRPKIVITFDDGDITNYTHAYPILKESGLTAYFFILVSKIGTNGYMNWRQIRELRDAGMIIGSHGMTHRILTKLDYKQLDYELGLSKKALEESLDNQIEHISIPRGFCNQSIIDKARQFGYKAVFTSNVNDTDGFKFGRIPVKTGWDLKHLVHVLNNGYGMQHKVKEFIKKSSKRIIGEKKYDKLRETLMNYNIGTFVHYK